jgi:hypothetical protein
MKRPDLSFTITDKIRIRVEYDRKRVVISCITKDGKSLQLETDYQALEQIHREIQKQLGSAIS